MVAERSKTHADSDVVVVDADMHVDDLPQFLAPYCETPWRKSLEILGQRPRRYPDIAGYSPGARFDPPMPGGQPALVETMGHAGGDIIIFASDWPHHDFDHPNALNRLSLTPRRRRKILGDNAMKLFKLPQPAKAVRAEEVI